MTAAIEAADSLKGVLFDSDGAAEPGTAVAERPGDAAEAASNAVEDMRENLATPLAVETDLRKAAEAGREVAETDAHQLASTANDARPDRSSNAQGALVLAIGAAGAELCGRRDLAIVLAGGALGLAWVLSR